MFNPAINEPRLPESDFEDDGKDDGGGDDGSGLVRTKKRKVTAAQSVTVAKRVTADRSKWIFSYQHVFFVINGVLEIPKGQGVDFDITIGRKYQGKYYCHPTPPFPPKFLSFLLHLLCIEHN